jgi:hypothetical protein
MKLFYDDKKIPMWVEWLAVVVVGVVFSVILVVSI